MVCGVKIRWYLICMAIKTKMYQQSCTDTITIASNNCIIFVTIFIVLFLKLYQIYSIFSSSANGLSHWTFQNSIFLLCDILLLKSIVFELNIVCGSFIMNNYEIMPITWNSPILITRSLAFLSLVSNASCKQRDFFSIARIQ